MTVKELKEQLNKFDDNLRVRVKNDYETHDDIYDVKHIVIEEEVYPAQLFIDHRRMEFVSLEVE